MRIKYFITITLLIVISYNTTAQKHKSSKKTGYNINITVNGIKDTVAYLGNYYRDKKYSLDTTRINSKGEMIFKGDEKLAGGLYFILFPSRKMSYFEVLIGDDQDFSLITDTTGFYQKNMKIKGSIDNEEFYAFQKKLNQFGKQLYDLNKKIKEKKDDTTFVKEQKEKLKKISEEREKLIETTVKNSKSKTLKVVVNLMREVKLPEFKVPQNVTNKDSALQMMKYYYYKNHYWDYVDFKDSTILRTPIFYPKLKQYISEVIVQIPDSVTKAGIELINKTKYNSEVYRFLIVFMLDYQNTSKLMGMDRVFVDIAKKYYLARKAPWADSALIAKIKERVDKTEPNLIGNQAPDLQRLETVDHQYISLYDIDAKYTILIFWEPHCGHCKKAVPKLYKEYLDMISKGIDVEVLAIYTQLEREPWEKFIKDKNITQWINAYDKYMFTNYRNLYDVYATPTIYVLDKDKKIIGKRLGVEQIQSFIKKLEQLN